MDTVRAELLIEMRVVCPNEECDAYINLLDAEDTDNHPHNEDGFLMRQMFPRNGSNEDFECDAVTCTVCKTEFNVRELGW